MASLAAKTLIASPVINKLLSKQSNSNSTGLIISIIVSIIITLVVFGVGLYFITRTPELSVVQEQQIQEQQIQEQQIQEQQSPEPINIQPAPLVSTPVAQAPVSSPTPTQAPAPVQTDISQQYIDKFYRIKFAGDKCVYPDNIWGCWDDPNMVFKIEDATNGKIRLHHIVSDKCMYIESGTLLLKSFACWGDSNMEFKLLKSSDGSLKLQHQNSQMCLKIDSQADGSPVKGGDCNGDNVIIDLIEVPAPV